MIAEAAGGLLYVAALVAGFDHKPNELTDSEIAAKVAIGINEERRIAGLQPLVIDPALEAMAADRNTQNIGWGLPLRHWNPETGQVAMFEAQVRAGILNYQLTGEILAMNNRSWSLTAGTAVSDWMNSSSHRRHMLEPGFVSMGIAVKRYPDGTTWYTVEFLGQPPVK